MRSARSNAKAVRWRTSSRSQNTNCVEVAALGRSNASPVAMRDSKDRGGTMLVFERQRWREFVTSTKEGEFDLT
jgi:hypothetical protein